MSDPSKKPGDDQQNVESLLRSMREKAETEQEEIRRDAEQQRREILENADREAERLKADAVKGVEREVGLAVAGRMGRARMEAQAATATTKSTHMEQVFERARARVEKISGDEYREILTRLVREAAKFIPGGGIVQVRGDDAETAKRAVADLDGNWKVEGIEAGHGAVVVIESSGVRRVDNGFVTRLSRAALALRDDVARVLFGSDSKSSA